MKNLKHKQAHSYVHQGTKQEHSTIPATVDDRSSLNFCVECNGWFYRGFPQHVKPSAFLAELDSHGIYMVDGLTKDFEEKTGVKLDPPVRGNKMTKREMRDIIATGGTINPACIGKEMIGGYSFALILCSRFKVPYESKLGRGTQFRACVDALRTAGK